MYSRDIMEMIIARSEALLSGNEVPVCAAVAIDCEVVSLAWNDVENGVSPIRHAEFLAVLDAMSKVGGKYLDMASIYVTLEPCSFCAALIEKVRLKSLFFGAYDPKAGAVFHNAKIFDHSLYKPNIIGGIQEERCMKTIKQFFKTVREK